MRTDSSSSALFGDLLKRFRLAAGLSQEELAERAGLSPRGVSDLERGARTNPRPGTVRLLADTLALTRDERASFLAAAQGPITGSRFRRDTPVPSDAHSLADHEGIPRRRDTLSSQDVAEGLPALSPAVHTFLIADVRGYTRFTVEHGDEAAARLATAFARLAREVVEAHGGRVIELRGDEALAVFVSTRRALRAALGLQERLTEAIASDPALPLRVGIGLDAGEALPVEGGYRGAALNLAARLCALAGPGEVLASEGIVHLARKVAGLTYEDRGTAQLKGFADPAHIFRVVDARDHAHESADASTVLATANETTTAPVQPVLPIGRFLGARPDEPLVAREVEMQQIIAALDAVTAGSGRLVLLAGEPGVGKTRLTQEAMLAARSHGFVVVTGRCYEPLQAVPYYPFLEALHHAYVQAPSALRRDLQMRWPSVLRLLPEEFAGIEQPSIGAAFGTGAGSSDDQQRLFWQVTGFLRALATEQPLALMLDDLHWADSASLGLVQHLARHARADRLLVLGTYRDVEIHRHHPLEAAFRDLMREHVLERLAVRRLSADGTNALIRAALHTADVSAEFTDLLHQHSEGNPFFTTELLRALIEQGDVYRDVGGAWDRRSIDAIVVPESVRAVIGQRLAHLSNETQAVVLEASVLGQTFSFTDLQAMSGRDEQVVEDALDEAMAAGMVHEAREAREASREENFTFHHALLQQALYAELTSRRKRRLHRAAAEAIERRPERERVRRCNELAWHFLEADESTRALPYVLQAGDQAEVVYAHAAAERHYRTAVELARERGDHAREAEALEKLADVLDALARYAESAQTLEQAEARYAALGDVEGLRRVTAERSLSYIALGQPAEGLARLQPWLAASQDAAPSRGIVLLYRAAASLYNRAGLYAQAMECANRALAYARSLGDDMLLLETTARSLGDVLLLETMTEWASHLDSSIRCFTQAVQAFEDVIQYAERVGDLRPLTNALNQLAHLALVRGDFAVSLGHIDRCLAIDQTLGSPGERAFHLMHRAYITFWSGDWSQTEQRYREAMGLDAAATDPYLQRRLLSVRALLCFSRGQLEEARQYLDEASAVEDSELLRKAGGTLAELDLLQGHPDAARRRLEPLLNPPGHEEMQAIFYLPYLAWAYLELGDVRSAEETADRIIAAAREGEARLGLVDGLRVRAMIAMRSGRESAAAEALDEALALCHAMAYDYGELKIQYTYGLLRMMQREPEQACSHFETGLVACRGLGERTYAERIEQELAKLGALTATSAREDAQ